MKTTTMKTTQWRCRAESTADVDLAKWALRGIASAYENVRPWLPEDDDEDSLTLPDAGFVFRTDSALTLEMVRWILYQLVDCHTMFDTLAEYSEYTGKRFYILEPSEYCEPPPSEVIKQVKENLTAYADYLEAVHSRALDCIEAFE